MGLTGSKEATSRHNSSFRSGSSSWSDHQSPYGQSQYGQESQSFAPQQSHWPQQHYPPSHEYGTQDYGGGQAPDNGKKLDRRYSRIADDYISLEQVSSLSMIFFCFSW